MSNKSTTLQLDRFELEKLSHLLECQEGDLMRLIEKSIKIVEKTDNVYDATMGLLQSGYNVREATLIGIMVGHIIGFKTAEKALEDDFKDMLYNSFKNNQK
jgi:hypothetical protein